MRAPTNTVIAAVLAAATAFASAQPLSDAFTYQGRLDDNGAAYTGIANFRFTTFTAPVGGLQAAGPIVVNGVTVEDGLFQTQVDFGPGAFDGSARWLRIEVDTGGGFSTIGPRQELTATPNALYAKRADSLDGFSPDSFLRANGSDIFTGAELRIEQASTLEVEGILRANSLIDRNNSAFFVDSSSTTTAARLAGSIELQDGESVFINNGEFFLSGANVVINLGDTAADVVATPAREIYMTSFTSPADGDQNIYFNDAAIPNNNFIRWDDNASITTCSDAANIDSGFFWQISDNFNTAWAFQQANDIEFAVDDTGDVEIDGSLTSAGSCDLAENYLSAFNLPAGTVVVVDPERAESVTGSTRAYQPRILGVVSTQPGVLLDGPTADAYPIMQQLDDMRTAMAIPAARKAEAEHIAAQIQSIPDIDDATHHARRADLQARYDQLLAPDPQLAAIKDDLEERLELWTRGNTPVALAGRVPVRVTGPVWTGDYLTTSNIPGVAMKMTAPGPALGIALSDFNGQGEGTVVVAIQPGFQDPMGALAAAPANGQLERADAAVVPVAYGSAAPDLDALRRDNADLKRQNAALDARLARLEALLAEN